MPAFKDITGQRFGRLTVIEKCSNKSPSVKGVMWLCRCDCGGSTTTRTSSLRSGRTKSCGCLHKEFLASGKARTTHGMRSTPEYRTWSLMKDRCYNRKTPGFYKYGGRGITVCKRWRNSFETFYADMGPRPSTNHSIDRIDNDGAYSPDNCRWATKKQQARNRRTNLTITFNGETMTSVEWSKRLGGKEMLVSQRIRLGWTEEEAVTIPAGGKRHK